MRKKNIDPEKVKRMLEQDAIDRANAQQGEFFVANVVTSTGEIIPHPVFILGRHNDSNDSEDVITCLCTHHPARGNYDLPVKLKDNSYVRTNKIYLVGRSQLVHKVRRLSVSPEDVTNIINKANHAIELL